jgi:hypothetical protein
VWRYVVEKSQRVKIVKIAVERHIKLTEKVCPQCEKKFMGMQIQKFCSKRCSNLAAYQRNPDIYRESRRRSYRKLKAEKETVAGKK